MKRPAKPSALKFALLVVLLVIATGGLTGKAGAQTSYVTSPPLAVASTCAPDSSGVRVCASDWADGTLINPTTRRPMLDAQALTGAYNIARAGAWEEFSYVTANSAEGGSRAATWVVRKVRKKVPSNQPLELKVNFKGAVQLTSYGLNVPCPYDDCSLPALYSVGWWYAIFGTGFSDVNTLYFDQTAGGPALSNWSQNYPAGGFVADNTFSDYLEWYNLGPVDLTNDVCLLAPAPGNPFCVGFHGRVFEGVSYVNRPWATMPSPPPPSSTNCSTGSPISVGGYAENPRQGLMIVNIVCNVPANPVTGEVAIYLDAETSRYAFAAIDPIFSVPPGRDDLELVSDSLDNPHPPGPELTQEELDALAAAGVDVATLISEGFLAPPGSRSADTMPPSTIAILTPAAGGGGWNNSNVTVALAASEEAGGSGVKQIQFSLAGAQTGGGVVPGSAASLPISAQGATTVTYFASDNAGNQEFPKTLVVRIDKTAPTISATRSPAANTYGWNNGPVVVTFQCTDSLSGLTMGSPSAPMTLSTEGAGQSATGTCTDLAGNTSSASVRNINIDMTPPAMIVRAAMDSLWPPNGKVVPDVISGEITDTLAGIDPTAAAFQVFDKYAVLQPRGSITVAPDGTFAIPLMLEASRLGEDRDGRQYQIVVTGADKAGNQSSASTVVIVPHDQR